MKATEQVQTLKIRGVEDLAGLNKMITRAKTAGTKLRSDGPPPYYNDWVYFFPHNKTLKGIPDRNHHIMKSLLPESVSSSIIEHRSVESFVEAVHSALEEQEHEQEQGKEVKIFGVEAELDGSTMMFTMDQDFAEKIVAGDEDKLVEFCEDRRSVRILLANAVQNG